MDTQGGDIGVAGLGNILACLTSTLEKLCLTVSKKMQALSGF